MGVSGFATELTIEQQAHNHGYERLDVKGCTADNSCCIMGADDVIIAGMDMKTVCEDVNNSGTKTKAEISYDPGRYTLKLCWEPVNFSIAFNLLNSMEAY